MQVAIAHVPVRDEPAFRHVSRHPGGAALDELRQHHDGQRDVVLEARAIHAAALPGCVSRSFQKASRSRSLLREHGVEHELALERAGEHAFQHGIEPYPRSATK